MNISCMCFSKDRPMQLEAYIRSIRCYSSSPIELTVLFKTGNDKFREAYSTLENDFPDVKFIEENNFRRQVYRWLKDTDSTFVMFGCDDVVFKESFDTEIIAEAFKDPDLFSFSLRLGAEINYASVACVTEINPPFLARGPFLLWDWRKASVDWNYPFELDCSVYRKIFIEKFIDLMNGITQEWGHPNRFESIGKNLADEINEFPLMASYPSSKANVITINRVQNICLNDVYDSSDIFSPEKLLALWNDGIILDIDAYHGKKYRAIHIGETFLCKRDNPEEKICGLPEYDIFKIMISDYAEKALKAKDTALTDHPGFHGFIKDFDAYFHMSGAETDQPVFFHPCLDDKKGKLSSPEKSTALAWINSRTELFKPEKTAAFELSAALPFADESIELLTAFDTIEYIGLGRYGDALDPEGSRKAFRETVRVIAPGGHFLGALPVAEIAAVCFNEKRVFTRENVLSFFPDFEIVSEKYFPAETGIAGKLTCLSELKYCIWCFDLEKK